MNVLETETWSMALAPEWWAEAEEDGTILVGDEDDVGCIEINTLHKEAGDFDAAELKAIATAESPEAGDWQQVRLGDFGGWYTAFTEGDAGVREWYVAAGSQLLFITYSCDLDNAGMDDSAVDALLDTLAVSSATEVS
ncbi:hypothetical protein [Kineobactrum sediminis]|nr:hypothetical protein [Kineobactrum sediminis]